MYQGHAINSPGPSKEAGRAADSVVVPVSARDGTRLRVISECQSPFMFFPSTYIPWPPPNVVFDHKGMSTTIVSLVRASIVGIVNDLEEVGPTFSDVLRWIFKFADDNGAWIYCYTHGKHAESKVLEYFVHICICFETGRSQVGRLPHRVVGIPRFLVHVLGPEGGVSAAARCAVERKVRFG